VTVNGVNPGRTGEDGRGDTNSEKGGRDGQAPEYGGARTYHPRVEVGQDQCDGGRGCGWPATFCRLHLVGIFLPFTSSILSRVFNSAEILPDLAWFNANTENPARGQVVEDLVGRGSGV